VTIGVVSPRGYPRRLRDAALRDSVREHRANRVDTEVTTPSLSVDRVKPV